MSTRKPLVYKPDTPQEPMSDTNRNLLFLLYGGIVLVIAACGLHSCAYS